MVAGISRERLATRIHKFWPRFFCSWDCIPSSSSVLLQELRFRRWRHRMETKKVGVLGCGLMGSGIVQVSAMAGFDTAVLEVEQKFLDKRFCGNRKVVVQVCCARRHCQGRRHL